MREGAGGETLRSADGIEPAHAVRTKSGAISIRIFICLPPQFFDTVLEFPHLLQSCCLECSELGILRVELFIELLDGLELNNSLSPTTIRSPFQVGCPEKCPDDS